MSWSLCMVAKFVLAIASIGCMHAQITSATLQRSFGSPETLSRKPVQQAFKIGREFKMLVDYDADGNACQIVLPFTTTSRDRAESILATAVPNSVRGEKWNAPE